MSLRFSGPLTMRFGPRATLLPSLVAIAAGLLLFARTPVDGSYVVDILPATVLIGLGAGPRLPALMTLAMSGATPSDSGPRLRPRQHDRAGRRRDRPGRARHAGDRAHRRAARRRPVRGAALNSGYHLAYLIGAALVGVAIVIALAVLRPPRQPEANDEHAHAPAKPRSARPAYNNA